MLWLFNSVIHLISQTLTLWLLSGMNNIRRSLSLQTSSMPFMQSQDEDESFGSGGDAYRVGQGPRVPRSKYNY